MKKSSALLIIILLVAIFSATAVVLARSVILGNRHTSNVVDAMIAEQASKAGLEVALKGYNSYPQILSWPTQTIDTGVTATMTATFPSANEIIIASVGQVGNVHIKHTLSRVLTAWTGGSPPPPPPPPPGPVTVVLKPDGQSISRPAIMFTAMPLASLPHYGTIDEGNPPTYSPDDTDFLFGRVMCTVAAFEFFTLPDNVVPAGATITNVTLRARHKENDAFSMTKIFVWRVGEGSPHLHNLPTPMFSWTTDSWSMNTIPDVGGNWTPTDINNLEIGTRLCASDPMGNPVSGASLSQYYAEVTYTP